MLYNIEGEEEKDERCEGHVIELKQLIGQVHFTTYTIEKSIIDFEVLPDSKPRSTSKSQLNNNRTQWSYECQISMYCLGQMNTPINLIHLPEYKIIYQKQ